MKRHLVLALLIAFGVHNAHAQSPRTAAVSPLALPDPGQPWSPQTLAEAATALASAAPDALPRQKEGPEGAAFARLVSPENLAALAIPTTPLEVRLAMSLKFAKATSGLLSTYLTAFNEGAELGPEVLALSAYVCEVAAAEWTLVDIFVKSLDTSAPDYDNRMKGLQQMRDGTATVLDGVLVTLSESKAYGKVALTWFAGQIRSTFPLLMRHAPEADQGALRIRLETQVNAEPSGPYRDALDGLLSAVKAAPP